MAVPPVPLSKVILGVQAAAAAAAAARKRRAGGLRNEAGIGIDGGTGIADEDERGGGGTEESMPGRSSGLEQRFPLELLQSIAAWQLE